VKLYALRHGQSEYNLKGLCNDAPAWGVGLTDANGELYTSELAAPA
jgi:broad specificity phosphatase PhoE